MSAEPLAPTDVTQSTKTAQFYADFQDWGCISMTEHLAYMHAAWVIPDTTKNKNTHPCQ